MRKRKGSKGEIFRALAMITQIGLSTMTSMAVSMFLGWWLDRLLGTRFIILIMLFVGIGASMKSILIVTKSFTKNSEKSEESERGQSKKNID